MASTQAVHVGVLGVTILALTLSLPPAAHATHPDALLISAIATGGTSASDEYVVIEAVGVGGAHIADYELVYTTASGATTRRLISLEGAAPLDAGARLLVANRLGGFSAGAFATWSEGIAATGGAVRLQLRANPTLIADAVAWGSATTGAGGFGAPTPAMTSATMAERRRGTDLTLVNEGNNSADFALVPIAPPKLTPEGPASPSPTPTLSPTPSPPAAALTATEARTVPLASVVTLHGTVSAAPGELAEDRLYSVEDAATGLGIFVLAQGGDTSLARGDLVTITGIVTLRRQALTLIATSTVEVGGWGEVRAALLVVPPSVGPQAWEPWEGRLIEVAGTVSGTPKALAGGSRSLTLRLPGGGVLLVGVASRVLDEIPQALLAAKQTLAVRGVMHQRAGVAGGGYRLWALSATASRPPPRTAGSAAVSGASTALGPPRIVPVLQVGTPSVATPGESQAWWGPQVTQTLDVRGGSLKLAGLEGVGLVVLPRCEEAQAVPAEIRAGGRVDRAGRAAYPQRR